MSKNSNRTSVGKTVALIVLGLTGLGLLIATFLRGTNVALLNPKGMIAQEQLNLGVLAIGLMLIIAIPTIFLLYFTAWKYRESNTRATHDPKGSHSKFLDLGMWLIPGMIAVILVGVLWPATHKLEPQKTIAADAQPITIQVISQRWKWVFIYPELEIATVNFVQLPLNTPVQFELTADDAPMSSFWIPNLGGMLYTMTGHTNRLNLIADKAGDYPGSSAEINGDGFAGMKFTARASDVSSFDRWVEEVRQSPTALDAAEYKKLLKPSQNNPVALYSNVDKGLYDTVLMKYMSHGHEATQDHSEHEH
jgi:cytochrome o ubiquinol oxidase subunit 2